MKKNHHIGSVEKKIINSQVNDQSPEVRAFIYQQITDLESLLPVGTAVSVLVDNGKVTFQLETSMGNLIVQSKNENVYKAITKAKNDLKDQLSTLQSFILGNSHDAQIDNIITKKYLH